VAAAYPGCLSWRSRASRTTPNPNRSRPKTMLFATASPTERSAGGSLKTGPYSVPQPKNTPPIRAARTTPATRITRSYCLLRARLARRILSPERRHARSADLARRRPSGSGRAAPGRASSIRPPERPCVCGSPRRRLGRPPRRLGLVVGSGRRHSGAAFCAVVPAGTTPIADSVTRSCLVAMSWPRGSVGMCVSHWMVSVLRRQLDGAARRTCGGRRAAHRPRRGNLSLSMRRLSMAAIGSADA
jgi:hypothetical protein